MALKSDKNIAADFHLDLAGKMRVRVMDIALVI